MDFQMIKAKLISLFQYEKLDGCMGNEWGFYNEINKDIKTIGYATNLTLETIHEAVKHNVDMIITHHDAWSFVYGLQEQCHKLLKENNMSHAFFHLSLDDAEFGTSASLANVLKLNGTYRAVPYEEKYLVGVIGEFEDAIEFEKLADNLSNILNEPIRVFKNNDRLVKKICITTGAGNMTSDIKVAVDDGCDAYITGEYNLYSQQYSKVAGIDLFVGSHTNTEIFGVFELVSQLVEGTNLEIVKLSEENY